MAKPHDRVIDNAAGFIGPDQEGTVEDVFSFQLVEAERLFSASGDIGFRMDIGAGYVFLSGFERILPILKGLIEGGYLQAVNDPDWGTKAPIRVVMGDETNRRTKNALLTLMTDQLASYDDNTLEFLVQMVRNGLIEIRVFTDRKFHAKIFHFYHGTGLPTDTWTGSANFTLGGLKNNIELCVPVAYTSDNMRSLYRSWFDSLWSKSTSDLGVLDLMEKIQTSEFLWCTPDIFFMKLIKLLGKTYLFDAISHTAEHRILMDFQTLSYSIVMERLYRYGGFILANSVGLGKSYVAAQAMFSAIRQNPDRKCLLVHPPRIRKEWKDTLDVYGISDHVVMLSRGVLQKPTHDSGHTNSFSVDDHDGRYSLIVVDEAHHFRNPSNRRKNLDELIRRNPQAYVLMVTATPVNLGVEDLFQLIDLFYRGDVMGRFSSHGFKVLYDSTRSDVSRLGSEGLSETIIRNVRRVENELVLKVSWRIVQEHFSKDLQKLSSGMAKYEEPVVREVRYKYGKRLVSQVFDEIVPFLKSLHYEPAKLWDGEGYRDDKNLTFWYKWQLYKRLESSLYAFYRSIENMAVRFAVYHETMLDERLYTPATIEETPIGVSREEFERTIDENRYIVIFDTFAKLDGSTRDLVISRTKQDLALIERMLDSLRDVLESPFEYPLKDDKKVAELEKLLRESQRPTIVFSQFADTIDYLYESLRNSGLRIESIHGRMRKQKDSLLKRFDSGDIDIILTTDVLAEGVNIPRADVVINFDLPYNPVLLIQRAGRALRITNPKKIEILNFVPAPSIDKELDLYNRLDVRLKTILSIVGLDFVVWLIEAKNVKKIHDRERSKFLNLYNSYKKKLAKSNPDDLALRVSLPSESKTDQILKRAIDYFGITAQDVENTPRPKKVFYTKVLGEKGVAVVTREGTVNMFVNGLQESLEFFDDDSVPQWVKEEHNNIIEEQRVQLMRDRASRQMLNRHERNLVRRLVETYHMLSSEESKAVISMVRHLAESRALTQEQVEIVEKGLEKVFESSTLLVDFDEDLLEGDSWREMAKIAEETVVPSAESLDLVAFVVYEEDL